MKKLITLSLILLFGGLVSAQPIPADSLYLGQTPPGNIPVIFGPGTVSIPGRSDYPISISPNGKEILFPIGNFPDKRTLIMEYKNNHWTSPDTVSFSMTRSADEAIFSANGERVYYYAFNAPVSFGGADLCYSEKVDTVWGEPINLGSPPNTAQNMYHPCLVADGSIYYENNAGSICYTKYENGVFQPGIVLPALINNAVVYGNPYVSPDESYLIFNSTRPGGYGNRDLYIAYKKNNGSWTNPKNLGNIINTASEESGGDITPDGLYMTYGSNNDIYWVKSSFIDSLRYTNFIPYVKKPIPLQVAIINQLFTFTMPDSTFVDDDGNNTLTYNATLPNGDPLPSWLSFDPLTLTFSGTPSAVDLFFVKITATDTAGATASVNMKITVNESNAIGDQTVKLGGVDVFPNPTNGLINIILHTSSGKSTSAEILNTKGEFVARKSFKNKGSIDLTGKPNGIYILKLFNDHEMIARKVVLNN